MKRIARSLLAATFLASVAAPGFATTLQYFPVSGRAYLLPSTSPSGKVLTYVLESNSQFFVDPARKSAFPPPGPLFYTNTTSEISDVDLTLQGTSAVIPLGRLFTSAVSSFQDLTDRFTNRIYVPSLGGGEFPITLEVANVDTPEPFVPEPATIVILGAGILALAAVRRRITTP